MTTISLQITLSTDLTEEEQKDWALNCAEHLGSTFNDDESIDAIHYLDEQRCPQCGLYGSPTTFFETLE